MTPFCPLLLGLYSLFFSLSVCWSVSCCSQTEEKPERDRTAAAVTLTQYLKKTFLTCSSLWTSLQAKLTVIKDSFLGKVRGGSGIRCSRNQQTSPLNHKNIIRPQSHKQMHSVWASKRHRNIPCVSFIWFLTNIFTRLPNLNLWTLTLSVLNDHFSSHIYPY